MKLENFVSNCRNRSTIVNKRGRAISVTCNHCPDCCARKADRHKQLIVQEQQRNGYTFHITLKYNDFCVPRMAFTDTFHNGMHILDFYDITQRTVYRRFFGHTKQITYKVPEYNQRIHQVTLTNAEMAKFRKLYNKTNIHSKFFDNAQLPQNFRYLRKTDLQLFHKNLRSFIAEDTSAKFKHFSCGEYGPETLRPHFHILLSTNDRGLAQNLEKYIRKAWQFGNFTCEQVDSSDKSAQYVGGYLNSYATLPYLYKGDEIKPFSTHSLYYGNLRYAEIRDYAYKNTSRVARTNLIRLSNFAYPILKTSAFDSVYFPRPYNYDQQTPQRLYALYTCYQKLSTVFTEAQSTSDLARCVIKYSFLYPELNDFLLSLDIIPYYSKANYYIDAPFFKLAHPSFYSQLYPSIHVTNNDYKSDYESTIFSRVYSTLLMSKRFLAFNCNNRDPFDVISIIKQYYDEKEHEMMRQYFEFQNEYIKRTGLYDMRVFWFNTPDYNRIYKYNPYICHINAFKDKDYENRIKHKNQNDKNKIFLTT